MSLLRLGELKIFAEKKGGKCLSESYHNSQTGMKWQCSKDHIWIGTANNVKRGKWRKICSLKRAGLTRRCTIQEMQQVAQEHGGLCLSIEYRGDKQKLEWQCALGHRWEAVPTNVKRGSWCSKCGYESSAELRKKDIQIIHDLAKQRGGECLSLNYEGMHIKLRWKCAHEHEWLASPSHILRGRWCSICSSYLGERICREYMEQIFGHAFPKSRPEWLFNSKGNRSELDGYCSELKLAFEHHGEQHYQIHNLYSKTQDKLNERQHEDRYKAHVCLENGVKIVVIPEIFSLTTLDGVINVIENECIEKKIKLPLSFDRNVHVDLKRAYSTNDAKIAIEELRAIALKRGGKCLSTTYERSSTKMSWECQNGHLFDARPNDIKRGVWCRKCSGLHPLSIKEMKLLAEKKRGHMLVE